MTTYRLTPRVTALAILIADQWGPTSTEARLITELTSALPRTLTQMVLNTPDGYPTSTPGASDRSNGGGRSTSSPDKLGNIIGLRTRSTNAYANLTAHITTATAAVAQHDRTQTRRSLGAALRITDEWHPPLATDTKSKLMCAHHLDNDNPVADWVDPLCDRIADIGRQGMCEPCYRRRLRWYQRHEDQAG